MAIQNLRFYLDENVFLAVAEQLRVRGIEAVSVRDLNQLGDTDGNHLARARSMGYVLCTYDNDFLKLAAHGQPHAGIVYGIQRIHHIGAWVQFLELLHATTTPEGMKNRIEYL